jgi:hypothetical protein
VDGIGPGSCSMADCGISGFLVLNFGALLPHVIRHLQVK